ncbi:DapH/DapD/GlmU-related protein [Microbacterium sp. HA-8]|uniref:DapH/DapD/GlmU-related protein n=1 Tax=Microbacterium sp. HA-8 TaxID=3234200 RepID=UPI0038F642F6
MTKRTLIHPTAIIGDEVELEAGVAVGPHTSIFGPVVVGEGAFIGPGVRIGSPPEIATLPQHPAWTRSATYEGVVIGPRAVIRDNVVIHQGSHRPTRIGADSWILTGAYLAHDVEVGDQATVSAGVSIGGHAQLGPRSNIGMNATIHQRRLVGPGAMIGMGTPLTRDAPPFSKVFGAPPRIRGINRRSLDHYGLDEDAIEQLIATYEKGGSLEQLSVHHSWSAHREALDWWIQREPLRPLEVLDSSRHDG